MLPGAPAVALGRGHQGGVAQVQGGGAQDCGLRPHVQPGEVRVPCGAPPPPPLAIPSPLLGEALQCALGVTLLWEPFAKFGSHGWGKVEGHKLHASLHGWFVF